MKIIIAILIFSAIILFHELGHFLLAKRAGIKVNEFCLGLGPTLFGVQKGETFYSLKLLPFGGACMMEGEDQESDSDRAFNNKSVWARISVVAAGPVFNFILAFFLAIIVIAIAGYDSTEIRGLMEDYPVAEAGVETGDVIVKINNQHVYVSREVDLFLQLHQGETFDLTYERDGKKNTVTVEPKYDEETRHYYAGIKGLGYREKGNVLQVLKYSVLEVRYWIKTTFQSLAMLFTGKVHVNDLSGPVGIVDVIGDTYEEAKSEGALTVFLNMVNMAILLTANLGVMNLLPFPALDGGRLVFLVIEAITKKRVPEKIEGTIHFVGLMLLLALMVFVMGNDIFKIVKK